MSKQAYDTILPEAQAVPDDQLKTPYMPVGTFIQEAEDLYAWANEDKTELAAAGLSESILLKLQTRTDACRFAQSLWMTNMKKRQVAEAEWAEKAPAAFDLQKQLQHTFRYAYRNNAEALATVDNIAEGHGNADMIQDLSDSAVLARKYTDELVAINFDMTLIDTAETLNGEMADLRALANGEKQGDNEALVIRNQMYTLLKQSVDEVRNCGKYVFWRNAKRIDGYSSRYNRSKKH